MSQPNLEARRVFRRAMDPFRDLSPEECRSLYVSRKDGLAEAILNALQEGDAGSTRILLAGARGCGKSTELARVMQRLIEDQDGPVPILINIAQDLPEGAGTAAWLPLVLSAVHMVANDWNAEGKDKAHVSIEGAMKGLGIATDTFSALLAAARPLTPFLGPKGQAVIGAAELGGEVVSNAHKAWQSASSRVAEKSPDRPALEAVCKALDEELLRIRRAAGRSAVLLLDGLDKRSSLDGVFSALDEAELLYGLPAALVLTGPMQLRQDPRFASQLMPGRFSALTLHNLPVVNHEGKAQETEIRLLLDLYKRRCDDAELSSELVPDPLLIQAGRWSSGVMREFLTLVGETGLKALRAGRKRAEQADLDDAVKERRTTLEATLTAEIVDVLLAALDLQEMPKGDHSELLFTNVLICYPNERLWVRPHELLIPYLQITSKNRSARSQHLD